LFWTDHWWISRCVCRFHPNKFAICNYNVVHAMRSHNHESMALRCTCKSADQRCHFLQNPQQRGTNLLRYNLRTPLEGKNDTWILQEPAQFHMKTRRFMKKPTLQRALSPAEVTFERLVHLQNFVTYSIHATTYPQAKAMRSFIAPMNCN